MDINEKICVITGGASGIGLGLAKALISRGGQVVIADINEDGAAAAAEALGPQASAAALDVRRSDSFEALADHVYATFGRVAAPRLRGRRRGLRASTGGAPGNSSWGPGAVSKGSRRPKIALTRLVFLGFRSSPGMANYSK